MPFWSTGESLEVLGVFLGGLCSATSCREGSLYMATGGRKKVANGQVANSKKNKTMVETS